MTTFIALLRGINVGKAKRIPMAELRGLLAELGYTGVETLLNSGNVVFRTKAGTPAKHAKAIAAAIVERFEMDVPVVVKSAGELAEIVQENPIEVDPADHSRLLVIFVQVTRELTRLTEITGLVGARDRFVVEGRAAYLFAADGILESKAAGALLGKTKSATTRNWATVLKLKQLVER